MTHGLMFHHFHGGRYAPSQGSLDVDSFNRLLDHAGGSRLAGATEWLGDFAANGGRSDRICITFDDALRCQMEIAVPVLAERGLTAFFFVYSSVFEGVMERLEVYRHLRMTQFPSVEAFYDAFFAKVDASSHATEVRWRLANFEPAAYLSSHPFYTDADRKFRFVRDQVLGEARYFEIMDRMVLAAGYDEDALRRHLWMDDGDLKTLVGAGHVVGLHSYSHPTNMGGLSRERQLAEYVRNHRHLSGVLGQPPTTVAHPCGSYSPETLDILAEMGVTVGFRSNMVRDERFGPLEISRLDHANVLAEING